jgi:toxin YhaV
VSGNIHNGWNVFFHPLFAQQRIKLLGKSRNLKSKLPEAEWLQHSDVKLLKAVMVGIREKIPQDPFAAHFALGGPLSRYARLKKMGLPSRYRLFFKPDRDRKVIVILWLGYPRKDGDKNDCYTVFEKMISKGEFPANIDELIQRCQEIG